ncbi:MAG: ABC transporter substrate-binding protein [Erysipelotrichaceae bacterium]|nr:ABC transporter substrate-binding protein [Erysipelotrichaceae bacterium]MDY4808949.1 ABC transporter substrate-binding protein [Bulleidia sp.]
MKLLKSLLAAALTVTVAACSSTGSSASSASSIKEEVNVPETVTVTDHADRTVEVPTNPEKVAILGIYPLASMLSVYLNSAETIVAMEPASANAAKNSVLIDLYPEIGNITTDILSGEDLNIEALVALEPEVVYYNAADKADLEKLENAGLTAVAFSPTKWKFDVVETYRQWIGLLDQIYPSSSKNAKLVDQYSTYIYNMIQETVAGVEQPQKILFLYQYDENAMITSSSRFFGEWWAKAAGGVNVASDVQAETANAKITMENVYEWNPDVIFITNFTKATPEDLYSNAIGTDDWSTVKAVQDHRVYKMPMGTYRTYTPSSDTPMTLLWMAQAVYPELFADVDVRAEVKDYYSQLFGITLTDDQIDRMYTPNAAASEMN